jgi:L-ribulose-5-phosphate 3-epimerase
MNHLKIGIRLESVGPTLRRAVQEAQRLGVRGVQADAIGDLSPATLSQTGRSAFRNLLRSHNLELTALACPLRRGLDSPENQEQRIDHLKAVLGLSVDLGARVAITQAGPISEKSNDPRGLRLIEVLQTLGHHGDRIGAVLALQTGLESGAVMADFLYRFRFDTNSLGVNLDPAKFLLHDFDPGASARALRGKVVHVRVADARLASVPQDVPLGQGDVDWPHYLEVLEEIEYHGWLTVDRSSGGNRVADIVADISFLEQSMAAPA